MSEPMTGMRQIGTMTANYGNASIQSEKGRELSETYHAVSPPPIRKNGFRDLCADEIVDDKRQRKQSRRKTPPPKCRHIRHNDLAHNLEPCVSERVDDVPRCNLLDTVCCCDESVSDAVTYRHDDIGLPASKDIGEFCHEWLTDGYDDGGGGRDGAGQRDLEYG